MSIAVEFSNMQKLRAFVRRTAHPQTLYRWQDVDSVLIRKLDARERRELRRGETTITAAWVWLPNVDPKDPSICSICDRLELRQQAALPVVNDALFREMNLEQLLRSSQLTKAAMARHRSRQDMVLALFGVTHAGASESYATAPKDESLETKVHFLAPNSDSEPSVLVELDQCDASVQWGMWLESENRRLAANGGGRARLFARVFAGDVDCYVEYRHQHPFGQEVGHLWPNRQRAHILLVDAASDATEDRPADAVWYPITEEHDVVERAETDNDAVKLFIDLSGQNVHVLPVSEVAQTEPLRIRPRIEPMFGQRGGRLENLNQRIQGVKSTLSRLEHQRATLLDYRRHVLRLTLRFRQPPPEDHKTPELAPNFQRFLLLSRRDLADFDYLYHENPDGSGCHVVVTRNPVAYQDVHRGLADDAFYQLAAWQQWGIELFVRDDCHITPRIDTKAVADGLVKALAPDSPTGNTDGQMLLVAPGSDASDQWNLTIVPSTGLKSLHERQEFLNTDYPTVELESRQQARTQFIAEAKRLQVDMEKQIEAIERAFKDRATERLESAHKKWNALSLQLERAALQLSSLSDRFENVEEILRDFAVSWVTFLDEMLTLNDALIAGKLDALEELDRKLEEWKSRLENVKKGNIDLAEFLPPLHEVIENRVAAVEVEHARAKLVYASVKAELERAQARLAVLLEQANKLLADIRRRARKVQEQEKEYGEKRARIVSLNDALKDLHDRLVSHLKVLALQLLASGVHLEHLERLGADLVAKQTALDQDAAAAEARFEAAGNYIESIRGSHAAYSEEIRQWEEILKKEDQDLEAAETELGKLVYALREQRAVVAGKLKKAANKKEELEAEIFALTEQRKQLAIAVEELKTLAATLTRIRSEIERLSKAKATNTDAVVTVAGEVQQLFADFEAARLREWHEKFQETSSRLRQLANLEAELGKHAPFHQAVSLQHEITDAFVDVSTDLRRIWEPVRN